jgi:KaiC/GvpD/RAD55 family RecA-like ATPase
MVVIERVTTGIPGLDKLIEGGLVKGSTNLLAGTTGTAKTIFGLQYILHGLKNGEPGVYVTLEQKADEILDDISRFGWDFEKYISTDKFKLEGLEPDDLIQISTTVFNTIKNIGAKRFVLDSLSIAAMGWKERPEEIFKLRGKIFHLMNTLKSTGVTSLLIAEIPEEKTKALSRFGFEEFLADGIIILHYLEYAAGGTPRSLLIRKMRRTDHGTDIYPIEITKTGIKLLPPKKGLVL